MANALAPALDARTLVREQHHRINNEFTSAINLVAVAAVRTDNRDVKAALCDVVELLHGHADVHHVLSVPDRDVLIDAAEYLRKLGLAVSRSKLDRMNIHLLLSTETLPLEAERCWLAGLIVHELVTNAVRHACLDGRDGEIKGTRWTSFALDFPLTQREQRASRALASRRPRTTRRLKTLPALQSVPVAGKQAKAVAVQPSP